MSDTIEVRNPRTGENDYKICVATDDIIAPMDTRKRVCESLQMLKDKKLDNPWRKHGNIPL